MQPPHADRHDNRAGKKRERVSLSRVPRGPSENREIVILQGDDDEDFAFIRSLPIRSSFYGGRLVFHSSTYSSDAQFLVQMRGKTYEPLMTIDVPGTTPGCPRQVVTCAKLQGETGQLVFAAFQAGSAKTREYAILFCVCLSVFAATQRRQFVQRVFIAPAALSYDEHRKPIGFPSVAVARELSMEHFTFISKTVYVTENGMGPYVDSLVDFTNIVTQNRVPILALHTEQEFDEWICRRDPSRRPSKSEEFGISDYLGHCRRVADYNRGFAEHEILEDFSAAALEILGVTGDGESDYDEEPSRSSSWSSAKGDHISARLGMGIEKGKRLSKLEFILENAAAEEANGDWGLSGDGPFSVAEDAIYYSEDEPDRETTGADDEPRFGKDSLASEELTILRNEIEGG